MGSPYPSFTGIRVCLVLGGIDSKPTTGRPSPPHEGTRVYLVLQRMDSQPAYPSTGGPHSCPVEIWRYLALLGAYNPTHPFGRHPLVVCGCATAQAAYTFT